MGTLWIGTWNGISRYDPDRDRFINIDANDGLSSNVTSCLQPDFSGGIWVGTQDNGLNRYDTILDQFHHLGTKLSSPERSIKSFYSSFQDSDGIVWLGTKDHGLCRFDPKTQTKQFYTHQSNDRNSLISNTITALSPDPDGSIWVGTWMHGLCHFDPVTGEAESFREHTQSETVMTSTIIRAIHIDRKGNVWVGTEGGGLNVWNPETRQFSYYKEDSKNESMRVNDRIHCIYEDKSGVVWIGGETHLSVLFKFDSETNSFTRYANPDTTGSVVVNAMLDDSRGCFWIGTNLGLFQFDRTSEKWLTVTAKNDPIRHDAYTLVEAEDGRIWFSTPMKICSFDPAQETLIEYDRRDGLNVGSFNRNVGFAARDGNLYFGGLGNMVYFNPKELRKNIRPPGVFIDRLSVQGQSYSNIPPSHEAIISLPYWMNTLAFQFDVLNFSKPELNQWKYRLKGIDEGWVEGNGEPSAARYHLVPPGDYMFEVSGANNNEIWNQKGSSIAFKIVPPFWKRWWFYVFECFALVMFVTILIYFRGRYIHAKNRRLQELIQLRNAQLKLQQDYLYSIFNSCPIMIVGFKPSGDITFMNPAGEAIFGNRSSLFLKKKWWYLPSLDEDRNQLQEIHHRILSTNEDNIEVTFTSPTGKTYSLILTFINRLDEKGKRIEIIAFGYDMTERLEKEILEISGREQRRIGHEIHDGLSQTLTGIGFMCDALTAKSGLMPEDMSLLTARIREYIRNVTDESRRLSHGLSLHVLEKQGLQTALSELVKNNQELFQIPCSLSFDDSAFIDDITVASHLYRIVQESLSNAAKHSQANQIHVQVERCETKIRLTVSDDGIGFSTEQPLNRGQGLNIMKSRARYINSKFKIHSQSGSGTKVVCSLHWPETT